MPAKLLVVEDDPEMAELLASALDEQYQVEQVSDGETALRRISESVPDLIILDLVLPGRHGIDVCGDIRSLCDAPILVVSGLTHVRDRVQALQAGADDYLTKPFSVDELLARAMALLRRSRMYRQETYDDGVISVDLRGRRVTRYGVPVSLTPREFLLLECLMRAAGRVQSHAELLRCGWGPGYASARASLHVYVHRLRAKIEPDPAKPRYIISVGGVGYVFQPQDKPDARR
ncbi:MAG: response regulator transcription factor [Anaerolineae bacterium]|nr:response regulator transcription factor [Anaerolineae bacterium]